MPTLVVLAAGMGSRYGGLKQIDPVGPVSGETLLDYSVYDAIRAGFERVVFIIRHDIEKDFKTCVSAKFKNRIDVACAFQQLEDLPEGHALPKGRKKPWGTGQAILTARPFVDEPFGVINADDFYGRDAFKQLALQLALSRPDRYAMIAYELGRTLSDFGHVSRGLCHVSSEKELIGIEEIPRIEKSAGGPIARTDSGADRYLNATAPVSMNMWGFNPSLFDHLAVGFRQFLAKHGTDLKKEYFIPFEVNDLIETGKIDLNVQMTNSPWFGVTYQEDRPTVCQKIRKLIEDGEYPESLWR